MPASVFVVGCGIGTESFNLNTAANMVHAADPCACQANLRCTETSSRASPAHNSELGGFRPAG